MLLFTIHLMFSCLYTFTEANSTEVARMTFRDKEAAMKRFPLSEPHEPVKLVLGGEPDSVTAVGQKRLVSFNFQDPQMPPKERKLSWEECTGSPQRICNYNITVVHERKEANQLFVCGTDSKETMCCDLHSSANSSMCVLSSKMENIKRSIQEFPIKEGEASALVESVGSADLYITYSGSHHYVGIHKFGRNRMGPAKHNKEQHYVGLALSERKGNPLQSKVYAFYNERNGDTGLYSDKWLPFVSQVCMSDIGGPKNTLQFTWTSQLNARLFCGDADSNQHFSELVEVATVHAERWQDTRVYALFRNEWGMSAVCVYTVHDIDHIFTTSTFKGGQRDRQRACVEDSTKIPLDTLTMIEQTSEMEQWVRPVSDSLPLLSKHHSYTHIRVDRFQDKRNKTHSVLYLSLNNGGIHKVINDGNQSFVIAEFQPFNQRTHILSMILHPSSKKLYVSSKSELVQLDVANCAQYGDHCEECVLARDPYCSWNRTHCTLETRGIVQDVAGGNHTKCMSVLNNQLGTVSRFSTEGDADDDVASISLPSQSKYFLHCPVSSHHAQYTWHQPASSTPCSSREPQCLLLIDNMGPEQEGMYRCVSEEKGYSRVLAQYQLQLRSGAARRPSGQLLWVCLLTVLIKCLYVPPE